MSVKPATRICCHLAHAHVRADQTDERSESFGQFLVESGDAPEVFDAAEEALDEVATAVDDLAPSNGLASVGALWDHCLGACIANRLPRAVAS